MAKCIITLEDKPDGVTGLKIEFDPWFDLGADDADLTPSQRIGRTLFEQLRTIDGVTVKSMVKE